MMSFTSSSSGPISSTTLFAAADSLRRRSMTSGVIGSRLSLFIKSGSSSIVTVLLAVVAIGALPG